MKKFLFSLFFVQTAFASFPIIDVHNITGEYLDAKGKAYAVKAYYEIEKVKIAHSEITIDVNKKQKNLVINDPNTSVQLDFDFSFLNVFKAFEFRGVDIKSDKKLFTVRAPELDFFISPKHYDLSNFFFETDVRNIPVGDDEDVTVVDGIILNARLFTAKMQFKNFDEQVFDEIRIENPGLNEKVSEMLKKAQSATIPMIIRHIKFSVKEGKFFGRAKLDSYINLWLRLWGNITTDKENTFLDIHLSKAKLGYFSIKSSLLGMVKRLNLDKVTVKGDHIIVNLTSIVVSKPRK